MSNIISIILLLTTTVVMIVNYMINKRAMEEIDRLKSTNIDHTNDINILLGDKAVDKINALLDKLISEAADKYKILVIKDELYITSKQIDEMTTYVTAMVNKNMTSSVLAALKLIYKIDNKKDLKDVLDLRIKIYMIGYALDHNSSNK